MPNDSGFVPRSVRADVVDVALAGLNASPKTLPAMLFYDDPGCRLFYEITRQPEYYLTRTEIALLKSIVPEVLPKGLTNATLVEFGGSDETKARILLDPPATPFVTYVSVDVAAASLTAMELRLAEAHPKLSVIPIAADFMQPLQLPATGSPCMGFFPGSTIGNLDPKAATRFLASARTTLGAESWFLLGADLRKSPGILLPAYNDKAGLTAAFNLNILQRLNREADANFDLGKFRHEAIWNDADSRIEMHLFSMRNQIVTVAGQEIRFQEAESIHTENSYKHTEDNLIRIAGDAGWETHRVWKDPAGLFGVFLLRGG